MKDKLLNVCLEHYRDEIERNPMNSVNMIKDIEEFVDDFEMELRNKYREFLVNFGPLINFPRGIKAKSRLK